MIDYNLENRVSRNTASNDLNGPVEGGIVMRTGGEMKYKISAQMMCKNTDGPEMEKLKKFSYSGLLRTL